MPETESKGWVMQKVMRCTKIVFPSNLELCSCLAAREGSLYVGHFTGFIRNKHAKWDDPDEYMTLSFQRNISIFAGHNPKLLELQGCTIAGVCS